MGVVYSCGCEDVAGCSGGDGNETAGGDMSMRIGNEDVSVARGETAVGGDAVTMGAGACESGVGVGVGADSGRTRCVRSHDEDDEVPCRGAAVKQ